MRNLDPTGGMAAATSSADVGEASAWRTKQWAVQGKHNELRRLLIRLGLRKYCRAFAKHGLDTIALLRSMAAVQSLRSNLEELGMVDEGDIALLQSAVLSHGAAGGLAASSDHTASADEVELSGDGESSEDEEIKARQRENPHLAIVTRKEYERILDWSDDEDMSTAQGRFNRRRKKEASYQAEHTTQCMMRAGEEGSVTDVSNGPRSILKRLLHAATPDAFLNPTDCLLYTSPSPRD